VPDHRISLTNLGEVLAAVGQLDEATALLEKATRLYPEDARIHNNLGNCYQAQGELAPALRQYRLAAVFDADMVDPRVNLGTVQARVGDRCDGLDRPEFLHRDGRIDDRTLFSNVLIFGGVGLIAAGGGILLWDLASPSGDPGEQRAALSLRVGAGSAALAGHF
jgi:tetratricopeptide (TPR) repeat protein